ncbi:hypothetical protein NLU13_7723 [Sarocladium strictum]|uniref:Zinc finger Mcm10/DnaG-type domain-containing protein n=1 Tax=Sarocladium strictum TaxID=5046 RepID=A0AA39L5V1_SARSR|nr:hypothetical protein NLU13_7723 [Sarocladium strictum]
MSGAGYLRKARAAVSSPSPAEPLSFNERLASVRTQEVERAQRKEYIQKSRSNAFGLGQREIDKYKSEAVDLPPELLSTPTYSREEILAKQPPTTALAALKRSNTAPNLRSPGKKARNSAANKKEEEGASFEAYSGFHLSRRILPHNILTRQLSGKSTYGLQDLLKHVKAPEWELPDVEDDVVVFGIVAKKSEPRLHNQAVQKKNNDGPRKYMVITLVDLKWELDMFLFNGGFERYWKLTEGTVIALLNPIIMPPRKGQEATGRFTLCLNSDADTVIEIGLARDLGFCQSVKKDGELCMAWTNKKRTQFCEFHTNEAVNKQRSSRVEMNNSSFGARKNNSREIYGYHQQKRQEKIDKRDGKYDHDTTTRYFISRSMSTADLIDGKDLTVVDKKERAEYVKRKLREKERENDIMARLGKTGGGAGKEYMKAAASRRTLTDDSKELESGGTRPSTQISIGYARDPTAPIPTIGARSREQAVQLGPMKRKRADSALSGLSTSSRLSRVTPSTSSTSKPTSALGWGGNLKDKLSRMKEGEKLRKEEESKRQQNERTTSPVRKKTRFVTENGIREAGRESLGNKLAGRQLVFDDDDDDELVIV